MHGKPGDNGRRGVARSRVSSRGRLDDSGIFKTLTGDGKAVFDYHRLFLVPMGIALFASVLLALFFHPPSDKAVEPPGDCRSDLHWIYDLGQRIRRKLRDSTDSRDRPILELTWNYPTQGPHG